MFIFIVISLENFGVVTELLTFSSTSSTLCSSIFSTAFKRTQSVPI